MKPRLLPGRKALLPILILISMLWLCSGTSAQQQTDTVFGASFRVNMSKAVMQGIFDPDSDYVYLVADHGIAPIRMVPEPGLKYAFTLGSGLDSGEVYNYHFRINDSLDENVNRQLTAVQGITYVNVWWNDDPANITTFRVNMSYMAQSGLFDPATDFVDVNGTMNNWQGSAPLTRDDTSLVYAITYPLDPGSVQQYKFRINGDSAGSELQGQPQRLLRIPDTALVANSFFNNYNPATLPMTFNCNMKYYLTAGFFDKNNDYLEVTGNFNNYGGNDVLFDADSDSLYSLVVYADTSWLSAGALKFKFRINGDTNTTELQGLPSRTYALHDTTGANPNVFSCWYDDKNPAIPTPPWAYNVAIQGHLINHRILSGIYSYANVNGIPEGTSLFRWYQSNDSLGTNPVAIDSATSIAYKIDTTNIGKWLIFEVTPIAASGDSATGKPVRVITASKIGGVGFEEMDAIDVKVYPNPFEELLSIETSEPIRGLEVISFTGRTLVSRQVNHSERTTLSLGGLPRGIYLLKVYGRDAGTGSVKIIRK
jgi:hypothetical protein